jgi:hypothetical protein
VTRPRRVECAPARSHLKPQLLQEPRGRQTPAQRGTPNRRIKHQQGINSQLRTESVPARISDGPRTADLISPGGPGPQSDFNKLCPCEFARRTNRRNGCATEPCISGIFQLEDQGVGREVRKLSNTFDELTILDELTMLVRHGCRRVRAIPRRPQSASLGLQASSPSFSENLVSSDFERPDENGSADALELKFQVGSESSCKGGAACGRAGVARGAVSESGTFRSFGTATF